MTEVQITTIDEDQLDTILALDVEFSGEMFFAKPLMIKGKVSGIVRSESDLFIDENAVVQADITANVVSVKGSVVGNISAREKVELFACASVDGDVVAPQITMEPGCRFNGACRMEAPKIDAGA
jgi:cytoskeletal protein CcmA (bactofilin family)